MRTNNNQATSPKTRLEHKIVMRFLMACDKTTSRCNKKIGHRQSKIANCVGSVQKQFHVCRYRLQYSFRQSDAATLRHRRQRSHARRRNGEIRQTKEPAKAECAQVLESCREMGLLIGKGGLWGQTIRFAPPMCINQADADFIIEAFDAAFAAL